jgi:3-phosphoshikimate 1-carboxyvinyltransferase
VLGLTPASRPAGALRVPGSKSLALRHVLLAGLAHGRTQLRGLSPALDVQAALGWAAQLAQSFERLDAFECAIRGRPPAAGGLRGANGSAVDIDVRESATLARLATAASALCGATGTLHRIGGSGSLERRRSAPLFATLRSAGVEIRSLGAADGWPVELSPLGPPSDLELNDPCSSQEVSALLIALAAYPGRNRLHVRGRAPSEPYIALTRACLELYGASAAAESAESPLACGVASATDASAGSATERLGATGTIYEVHGPLVAPEQPIAIEPDASAAAVALAAAAIADQEAWVPGLSLASAQGDVRFAEHARAFGCAAGFDARGEWVRGRPRHGARIDLVGEPDLAPVLAALAACAALGSRDARVGTSLLTGLSSLRGKESDRIACLCRGLSRLGLCVGRGSDFLRIAPGAGGPPAAGAVLDPDGDHRMAFAFALCGLLAPRIGVRDPHCVAKSWPGFWKDLARAGAVVEVQA